MPDILLVLAGPGERLWGPQLPLFTSWVEGLSCLSNPGAVPRAQKAAFFSCLVFQRDRSNPPGLASSCLLKTRLPQEPEVLGSGASLALEAVSDFPLHELPLPVPSGPSCSNTIVRQRKWLETEAGTRTGVRNCGEGISNYCVLGPWRGSEHCTLALL